jgi:hypothetical protein
MVRLGHWGYICTVEALANVYKWRVGVTGSLKEHFINN